MKFVNPLAHVTAAIAPVVIIAGKTIPFEPLGLNEITVIAARFPFLQAQLEGQNVDLSAVSKADEKEMAVAIIATALGAGAEPGPEYDAMVASIRALKPVERELAIATIMRASMPDTVVEEAFQMSATKGPAKRAPTATGVKRRGRPPKAR